MQHVPLTALWLPILLSAVIVFVASSIMHMLLPYHRSDYRKLPNEDQVLDALRSAGVTPGREYRFPYGTMKDMKTPEMQEKFKRGPVGILTIMPSGTMNMGKFLGQWFVYCVVISIFAAYLTSRTRPAGTDYLEVFRVAGCSAFMGYSLAQIQNAIWDGRTWGVTAKHMIDGLIYGLLTAGTFGWLWPR
jgi:nucleoside recognition membrane protein YjiH